MEEPKTEITLTQWINLTARIIDLEREIKNLKIKETK